MVKCRTTSVAKKCSPQKRHAGCKQSLCRRKEATEGFSLDKLAAPILLTFNSVLCNHPVREKNDKIFLIWLFNNYYIRTVKIIWSNTHVQKGRDSQKRPFSSRFLLGGKGWGGVCRHFKILLSIFYGPKSNKEEAWNGQKLGKFQNWISFGTIKGKGGPEVSVVKNYLEGLFLNLTLNSMYYIPNGSYLASSVWRYPKC